MSQQGKKRSRSSTPEETQADAKIPRHEVQSSKGVQREETSIVIPEVVGGLQGDKGGEDRQVSDLRKYDDDGLLIIRPPPPITNWRFGVREPSPPPVLTDEEREVEELWEEMDFLLQYREDSTSAAGTEENSHECLHDGSGIEKTGEASSSNSG